MADKFENKKPLPQIKQKKLKKTPLQGTSKDEVVIGGAELGNSQGQVAYRNQRVVIQNVTNEHRTIEDKSKALRTLNDGSAECLKKSMKSNLVLAGLSGVLGQSQGLSYKMRNSQANLTDGESGLNLFTHHQKRDLEGTQALVRDYDNLKLAVLELYLSVKIRSDDEIDDYNKDKFEQEKIDLKDVCGYTLIDDIKGAIEQLMSMKGDESGEVSLDDYKQRQYNESGDLDASIEIDLPEGAKQGLKDATQKDINIKTDKSMQEDLKKSLPFAKKNKNDKKNAQKDEPIPGLVKDNKQIMQVDLDDRVVDQDILKKLNQNSATNQSETTSIKQLHNKLLDVASPSSSKPDDEDDYYQENEDGELQHMYPETETQSDATSASIPMAHREYEKILRQLEAECRTHIKCEQQMKLHIECLQEKLDQTQKDADIAKVESDDTMKKKLEEHKVELKKLQSEIENLNSIVSQNQAKLDQLDNENNETLRQLQVEKQNHSQKVQQLEKKLDKSLDQYKQLFLSQVPKNQMNQGNQRQGNSNFSSKNQLGDQHNLTDSSQQNRNVDFNQKKHADYSDFQNANLQNQVGFATTQQTSAQNQSMKGTKYSNDIRKQNQRSQSVLKQHTEFNHNFGNYQATSGSIGSSTTQRVSVNNLNMQPNSKSTAKAAGVNNVNSMISFSTQNNVNSNSKHLRSKKNMSNIPGAQQNVLISQNASHRQSLSNNPSGIHGSGGDRRQQLQSSQNLNGEQNPYRVETFSQIHLNQNIGGKMGARGANNKSAMAYNNLNQSQKELMNAIKHNSPDTNAKKAKQLAGKFDQSDIKHLGSIAKHLATSDPKTQGFQASINLMDNGGKLQKLEHFNSDIPQQMTQISSITVSDNNMATQYKSQHISKSNNFAHLKQSNPQNSSQQNMYVVNQNGAVVTTTGQGSQAQLKISSTNFNVSGGSIPQNQQMQQFLASGGKNNSQVQVNNKNHVRSITKLEKSNGYTSVVQHAANRSKSNGRQNVNSYGKLQSSKQLYDNSITTREANTIQQEQLFDKQRNSKNGHRVVHQLTNIYNNQNPVSQNPVQNKNQAKFTNQLSDRQYNSGGAQQAHLRTKSDNPQTLLPTAIGAQNYNTEGTGTKKFKQNPIGYNQQVQQQYGQMTSGANSKSVTVDASQYPTQQKSKMNSHTQSMTKLDKNKY